MARMYMAQNAPKINEPMDTLKVKGSSPMHKLTSVSTLQRYTPHQVV